MIPWPRLRRVVLAAVLFSAAHAQASEVVRVPSRDGTVLIVSCGRGRSR